MFTEQQGLLWVFQNPMWPLSFGYVHVFVVHFRNVFHFL